MQLYNISDKGELIKLEKLAFEQNDVYLVDDDKKNTIFIWVGLSVPEEKRSIIADIARKLDKEHGGSAKILIMKQNREYGSFLSMMHELEKGLIPGKSIERRPEFVFKKPPKSIKPEVEVKEGREFKFEDRILEWYQQIKNHRKTEIIEKVEEPPRPVDFTELKPPIKETEIKEEISTVKWLKQLNEYRTIIPKKEVVGKTAAPEIVEEIEGPKIIEELAEPIIMEEPEEPTLKTQVREAAYYLSKKGYSYNDMCWMLAEHIQKISLELPSIEDIKKKAEEVFNSSCTYDELAWLIAEMEILQKQKYLEKPERKPFQY